MTSKNLAIIGSGLAGLFLGYYLSKKEIFNIDIYESQSESSFFNQNESASWAAAGMLCPTHEIDFEELDILKAGIESLKLYNDIEQQLGNAIELNRNGTLEIALTQNDLPYLERIFQFQKNNRQNVEWLKSNQLLDFEPKLSTKIPAGIFAQNDYQVNQRALINLLYQYLTQNNVRFYFSSPISHIDLLNENEYKLEISKTILPTIYHQVALCTGTYKLEGLDFQPTIYPIRGQMVSLIPSELYQPNHTIRIQSRQLGKGYIVPKNDRIIIGSTSEEMGSDKNCTLGGIMDIFTRAYDAIPSLYDAPILETWTGLRPSTLHRKPIIDQDPKTKIFYLNGLYRNGVLLSPFAGKYLADFIATNDKPTQILPFGF